MGAEGGDGGLFPERGGPGPGGEDDGACGESGGRRAIFGCVGYALNRAVGLVDAGGGAVEDGGARGGGEIRHAGGEVVGVDLRGGQGRAHFIVAFETFGGDPVEVFGDAGGSEESDGFLSSFLEAHG